MNVPPVLLAFAAVFAAAAIVHDAPASAGGSVSFSASQAALGAKAFAKSCAQCHGADLKGVSAPALVGKESGIAQQTVVEVYEYVAQQMPMSAPGSLSKTQYVDIVAYLLQKNGHKPGSQGLTESTATTSTATIASR